MTGSVGGDPAAEGRVTSIQLQRILAARHASRKERVARCIDCVSLPRGADGRSIVGKAYEGWSRNRAMAARRAGGG